MVNSFFDELLKPLFLFFGKFLVDDNFFQLMYYSNILNHFLCFLFNMLIYCKQLSRYSAATDSATGPKATWESLCLPVG